MSTIQNARDILLQATSPRIYPLGLPVGTIVDYDDLAPGLGADITAAVSNSNAAIAAVGGIASDSMLSALEKKSVRVEWESIAAEKSLLEAQATTYGITTQKNQYTTAFQALADYLNNGVAWASGIPSWINDTNISANQTIVASTYRGKWTDYYTKRVSLIKKVTDVANTDTTAAATTAIWTGVTGSGKPENNATQNLGAFANLAGSLTSTNYSTYVSPNAFTILGFSQNQSISTGNVVTSVNVNSDNKPVVIVFTGRMATSSLNTPTGVQILVAVLKVNGVTKYNDQLARFAHLQNGEFQQGTFSQVIMLGAPGSGSVTYELTVSTWCTQGGANNSTCGWPTLQVMGLKV
jgi:hypothetical protein